MLNLNYNIIGSVNIGGAQPFRAGAVYSVRNDIYSSSIVVAIPGNLFFDGDYQNQFGMNYAWDDISAYVKGGPNKAPIGSNLSVQVATSGSGVLYPTSSVIKWPVGDTRYNESLFVNSTSSLQVLTTFPAKQGANLSYSSSFVIEAWTAWNVTASLSASGVIEPIDYGYSPSRFTAYKYDPGAPTTGAYVWETTWGGDADAGIGFKLVSGSARWIWDFNIPGQNEFEFAGTSSFANTPSIFNHYAISYTSVDTLDSQYNRYLRIYINGICQNQFQVPTNIDINQDTTELLQIFGALDTGGYVYAGRGQAYYQDFRMYNGTNKNYTGSLIPLPESMVVWN